MHKHKNSETVTARRRNAKLRHKYCNTNIYDLYKKYETRAVRVFRTAIKMVKKGEGVQRSDTWSSVTDNDWIFFTDAFFPCKKITCRYCIGHGEKKIRTAVAKILFSNKVKNQPWSTNQLLIMKKPFLVCLRTAVGVFKQTNGQDNQKAT